MLIESPPAVSDTAAVTLDVAANLRALSQLAETHERIAGRIKEIQAFSEQEILACGNVLSLIVDKARQLAEESDQAVAMSVARTEQTTSLFVDGMRQDILAQEMAVQRVLELTSGIEQAVAAINDLTLSSKVLAINARIEAARLGIHGKGFAVIADSLAGLSGVIHGATDTVSSSIEAVRNGLPPVSARATAMRERTDVFISEVATQMRSASLQTHSGQAENRRLGILMELSNQALSHLQFQDPMSQKLLSIVRELNTATERVEQVLKGEAGFEAFEADNVAAVVENEPPPGEIMLF